MTAKRKRKSASSLPKHGDHKRRRIDFVKLIAKASRTTRDKSKLSITDLPDFKYSKRFQHSLKQIRLLSKRQPHNVFFIYRNPEFAHATSELNVQWKRMLEVRAKSRPWLRKLLQNMTKESFERNPSCSDEPEGILALAKRAKNIFGDVVNVFELGNIVEKFLGSDV